MTGRLPNRKNNPQAIQKAKKPAPKKPAPKKSAPKKPAPKKSAPKKSAPRKPAPRKPAPSQRKTLSRAVRYTKTLAANPAPPFADSPSPTSPPLTDRPRAREKKRRHDSQDDHSEKQLQKKRQVASGSGQSISDHASQNDTPAKPLQDNSRFASWLNQLLTEENLATLERLTWSTPYDNMERTIITPEKGGRKRPFSRQSISAGFTHVTPSAESSKATTKGTGTYAHYRWVTLDRARVYVCSSPPPKDIQVRIDAVIERETSEERKLEVTAIAQQLCADFVPVLNGAGKEDDSVEPIYRALSVLDKNQKCEFPRKMDWAPSLKPHVALFFWRLPSPDRSNVDADEADVSPSKRIQIGTTSNSADRPQTTMALPRPPLLQPQEGNALLKTPCPDITMGLRHPTMVNTLVAKGISEDQADGFLKFLQEQHRLCSSPSQQGVPIRFPVLVVEGKSYSTSKFVFEAQNQAAVSGSCMINMQLQLDELFESFAPGPYTKKAPLAFSICTEGPHIELWVHYTTSTNGRRNYNMSILKTCHALLLAGVVDFLVVVDKVLSWASSEFADDVAELLASVERAAQQYGA
ncbi:MAG: hypothetical protein FRX48_09542 [Lasallia pustulata]|uniref:DUF7924 domain-containing protein n=1 Tax=Lasallia pustulata TaxID=136370 RepID=A0A5M8PCE1_9LECA|nr:MAG: hypothetical protein FRX48_09542 [Lasallia pustulata]